MTLLDPTLGVGYAFGEKLPSTHMTTIATQQPRALDIVNGGPYVQSGQLVIDGDALKGGGTEPILYTNLLGIVGAGLNGETRWQHPCVIDGSDMDAITGSSVSIDATSTLNVAGTMDAQAASIVNINPTSTVTWTGATNLPKLGSRTYTKTASLESGRAANITSLVSPPYVAWHYSPQLNYDSIWLQTETNGSGPGFQLYIPLDVFRNSVLTSVSVNLTGGYGAGHGATLPGNMPIVEVCSVDPATGTRTVLGTTTDTSASAAAYDVAHTITVGGLAVTTLATLQYQVRITGEGIANSVNNTLAVLGVTSLYTCTEIHPG